MISREACGAFTRQQALQFYSPKAIRCFFQRGEWVRLAHGVYSDVRHAGDPVTRAAGALLIYGSAVLISHHTAAELHGFGVMRSPNVHVTAGAGHDIPGARGVTVHTSVLTVDSEIVQGIAVTSRARTATDLLRQYRPRFGLAIADAALRTGLTLEELQAEVELHACLRGVRQARISAGWADPRADSPPESEVRALILQSDLPLPGLQVAIADNWGREIYRFDLGWEEYKVAAEYDGEEFHLHNLKTFERDREKSNYAFSRGWEVFRFTKKHLKTGSRGIVSPLRDALLRRGWRPS